MLDHVAKAAAPAADTPLLTMAEARLRLAGDRALAILVGWVESYLMSAHPDLGRTGAVCPFTRQAAKLDTVRVAVSAARPGEEEKAFALMRQNFADLEQIPCKPGMEHFRTIIVGFPNCNDADGVAMLARVQKRHKVYSLSRFRMIGFMHPEADAPGLWNRDFRPLRSPFPVLAIRHLVEQDAPFAAWHPLLLAPYLLKFRFAGLKRLIAYYRG